MKQRVVITAMGMHTSLGSDPDTVLANLQGDCTGFRRSQIVPEVIVCPVKSFDLKSLSGPCKNRRYLNRGAGFCVGAALSAVKTSNPSQEQLSSAGIIIGTGPNLDMDPELPRKENGEVAWHRVSALWLLKFIANTPAAVLSQLIQINGESLSIQTACTAGLTAVGEAYRKIRNGDLQVALAGAGDSRLSLGAIMAYSKAQALYSGADPPDQACRPFDENRKGFVSGEGGAFFILESLDHAHRRKASVLAEIKGFGASMDAHAMTAPDPEGRYAEQAVRKAIADAGLAPEDIQFVSAHGTGTPANDEMEANVLARLFGNEGPPITAFKSWIGHLSAACGAVELALALVCLKNDFWPRIRNLNRPCSSHLNFLERDLAMPVKTVLLQNFGFGGQNCALVIHKGAQHA